MRHLMVLLAVGIDEALRVDPDPILAVGRTSMDDILTWGMECPDCIYLRATLRAGETYRLFGNRGTARYVGLQTMDGIVVDHQLPGRRTRGGRRRELRGRSCPPTSTKETGCGSPVTIPR